MVVYRYHCLKHARLSIFRNVRVLFLPAPTTGSAFVLVSLAWAFRAAGHDVTFVSAGAGLTAGRAGLTVLDAGDPDAGAHVAVAEQVRPELVVYDPAFGAGPVVAANLGVPAVAHAVGLSPCPPELLREDTLTIAVAPPSLAEGPPSDLAMRYTPYDGGGVLPAWLRTPAERPRIAAIFESAREAEGLGIGRIAAASGDLEYVLALGEDDPPAGLPPNVRTLHRVPPSALLRTCAAAVHRGGAGAVLTCCTLGVVQLALPSGLDAFVNGELLQARGAAHVLPDADGLNQADVRDLLADDKLRRVADEIRWEIAALPPPADVALRLVLEC
jgi:UDP:flavonoid glycosyltransferase YjiC (YdhE family)